MSSSSSVVQSNISPKNEKEEEWIFSLYLPFASHSVEQLVITHKPIQQQRENQQERDISTTSTSSFVSSDDDDEDDILAASPETKSLLDHTEDDDGEVDGTELSGKKVVSPVISRSSFPHTATADYCCWKYTSPLGKVLQSSILLQLSYRPAWQSIPEYTSTRTRRKLSQIFCGCCGSEDELQREEQQIWEVYTTQHIVKTIKTYITIRGMGKCQAIQVFLQPLSGSYLSHESTTADNSENNDVDNDDDDIRFPSSSPPRPPGNFQSALKCHETRMGHQQHQQQHNQNQPPQPPTQNHRAGSGAWTRFTGPKDSLPLHPKKEDSHYIIITFAIPVKTETRYDPPLLWKVDLPPPPPPPPPSPRRSGGRYPSVSTSTVTSIMLDTITVLDGSVDLKEPATHVYIQGYQSWSYTGSVWKGQPQPKPALPDMFSRAFNFGGTIPQKPTLVLPMDGFSNGGGVAGSFTKATSVAAATAYYYQQTEHNRKYQSDFFTCITTGRGQIMDEIGGPALLCGWLSQHEQFGVVTMDVELQHVTMHASHHAVLSSSNRNRVTTDWAYGQLISPHHYDEEPMVHFLHAAAAYNQARPLQNGPLLTGWCSWYHYYDNITEANLRSNFAKLDSMKTKVPTNVAVVDDGYMTAWGDWDSLKPKKFSDLRVVQRDIVSHGMRPGLWLAPFACDKHSSIVRKHPEWIIRNERGVPANSSNCGKFFYGLDATNPQVRQHAFESIRRAVHDWGFNVLKIDFLYAACLEGNGKYDMSISRAQAMHLALQTIRQAAGPEVFLIGCGCPIGTGIGYVDGMRISADTGPTWYPAFPLPWWDHSTLPSLRAMIRNSMNRAPMGHRWWHNDPDCLLLGETTSLTNEEVASAASIVAMTCGMMLLSDDLTKVSIARMRILTKIFPMTGVTAIVLDLHTTTNKGLPSIMRLWCTDKYNSLEQYRRSEPFKQSQRERNHNAEATHFGRQASFSLDEPLRHPNERMRSCIHVAKGLGTWTVISLSNWEDSTRLMHIPRLAIEPPPKGGWGCNTVATTTTSGSGDDEQLTSSSNRSNDDDVGGFHVFSFWSGRYSWMSKKDCENDGSSSSTAAATGPLNRHLGPHETEIFHIRPVTPSLPQYVGSDLHFSCGHEVLSFDISPPDRHVTIQLKTDLKRVGHVYLFVPIVDTRHVRVVAGGKPSSRWTVVGNVPQDVGGGTAQCCGRILRIMVVVHNDGSEHDGRLTVEY